MADCTVDTMRLAPIPLGLIKRFGEMMQLGATHGSMLRYDGWWRIYRHCKGLRSECGMFGLRY